MLAVFARPDHPKGYVMGQGHSAHGYIVVFVRCANEDELDAVTKLLTSYGQGLPEPFGHTYQWYGGRMDRIAILPDTDTVQLWRDYSRADETTKLSRGDNRFIGVYNAGELLDAE